MTDLTDIRAIFNQGSAIRASDLNRNFEQIQFALQEGRCQLSELVLGYLQDYYWNKFDTTAYSSDTWPVNDQNLATTSAIDSRIDFKIDEALTNDIAAAAGSGLTVTDDGDGTITLDFDQNITLSVSPTSGLTKTDNGDGTTTLGINSWGVYLNSLNFTDEASFKQSVNLEIGVDVQAYDPNTAKLDVAQTFTADQTFTGTQTYPKIPSNAQTVAYTLVASDAGKHINATNSVTVPSGVFGVGDAISIYNNSGSNQTIVQGATVTIRQSGTANTGNRTLAQYGLCTLLCVASNEFVIAGSGLS